MQWIRPLGMLLLVATVHAAQLRPQARTSPPKAAPARPNIILITVDTTRADRVGFLGSRLGLTPQLDSVAARSAVFTHAYSHVPLTTASHATILTGTYPQYNHVNDFGVPLAAGLPYLPDILHQSGYHTAAFVGSLILDPISGTAPGFDRAFDIYDAGFRMKGPKESRYDTVERRAGDVVAHALAWLNQKPKGPFFVWIHLYDPHDPYDPPEPYKSRFTDPYNGEIAYADAMLGNLFSALRSKGWFDSSIIAVMADHGEAFGEHGERSHGIFLYDETIHVPLMMKLAGDLAVGKRVETKVGLTDVMPTLLDAAGIVVPKEVQGKSLLGYLKSHSADTSPRKAADSPVYSETDYPHRAFKWSSLRSIRTDKYLFIEAPKSELYDQRSDTAAMQDLSANSPAVTNLLRAQTEEFRKNTAADLAVAAQLGPEQADALRALGYASDESSPLREGKVDGIDPKDRVEIANLMHDGMMLVEQGRYEEAVSRLLRVLEVEPNTGIAYVQLGTAYTRTKQYDKALPVLRKAVALKAQSSLAQYELGLALFETGSWKEAVPEFEQVVAKMPKWADAQFSLASVYARTDRVPEAMEHLDICLSLDPAHYRANLLRGRILSLQHKAAEAVPNLEKAAEVQPDSREAHLFLADAYEQLGESVKAAAERARAAQR